MNITKTQITMINISLTELQALRLGQLLSHIDVSALNDHATSNNCLSDLELLQIEAVKIKLLSLIND